MAENLNLWSKTASDNATADPAVPWVENMLPGAVNNVSRSEMAAVARWRDDINGSITTGGSSNAYTATSNSGLTAYANNVLITIKANHTNTGAATLNLNTYGAKKIQIFTEGAESAVAAGQIISGGRYQLAYDTALDSASGAFLLLNPAPDPSQIIRLGLIQLWTASSLPTGRWLWCNGATIGDASSGGTALASADASSLFTHLYGAYANSELAVSGGRGASAAADFAAHKTIALPDLRGRAPFGSNGMATGGAGRITTGGSSIDGDTLGTSGGLQNHTLTLAQSPAHTHSGTTGDQSQVHTHSGTTSTESVALNVSYSGPPTDRDNTPSVGSGGDNWGGAPVPSTSGNTPAHTHTITTGSESANHNHSFTTDSKGSGTAHNNMPPTLIVNFVIRY